MNVNVYLPDELGKRAKEAKLPLSRMLQKAIKRELDDLTTYREALEREVGF